MNNIISLGRPLDPQYSTNRAIVILTVVIGLTGGTWQLFSGSGLVNSAVWAVQAAGGVFLAWALSRELDPDNDLSAFVSSGLAIASLFVISAPSLLALFWCLWMLRILNRTTGLPATVLDGLILLGVGGWLGWQSNGVYLAMTGLVFILDGVLKPANRKLLALAGATAIVGGVLALAFQVPLGEIDPRGVSTIPWLAITIVFIPVIGSTRQLESTCDFTNEPLNPTRLRVAQGMALLTAVLITLFTGSEGALSLLPLWMAFLGVAVYRAGKWVGGRLGD